ncbi:iron chelate uptake ABC transporter family permease subunit [Microbacterium sp. Kw_RZR3]|jgi:iron complex transport system permease protein|uniref:FecCD family ABC transporter permease n=1 Tax=unclassified Microbacterium TaxID=2609290 RepID=UPI0023DCBE83|nr:iron chelate uptake ABC transporter family permease subunit [Microbacterium sp. Kw_RZR3]MDF2048062.1 iron chelate uptake ABC transporter family permease subunit [Microbacterium sp. Kw_RZR3]MDF2919413.1 ABC-type enterobactin transport system, permease component [Microbacterium sp.]
MSAPSRTRLSRRGRPLAVAAILIAVAVGAAAVGLTTGSFDASLGDVASALTGDADARTTVVVMGMRMPRLAAALLIGAALGMAGAVFQTLARNPIASPDIVGFTAGSATGALIGLTLISPPPSPAIGAWTGGLLTVIVVMGIARSVGISRERTILAGIALTTLLAAVNDYLLTRAPLDVARNATQWLHGSLAATSANDVVLLLAALGVLSAVLVALHRDYRALEFDDDTARSLGVRTGRVRLSLVVVAALLTGTATAVAGPIGFVALAAPQLARRAMGASGIPLVGSALTGAVVLIVADVVAQRALAPVQIPVGLLTAAVGGAYLFWIVARSRR